MKIFVNNTSVFLIEDETLVAQSKKTYTVNVTFDSFWDGFVKTASFYAGSITENVALSNNSCTIPSKCLEVGGIDLKVKFTGVKTIQNEEIFIETDLSLISRILMNPHFDPIPSPASDAIRSGELVEHIAKFYTTSDMSGSPAFTLNFPEEMFLDQTETKFVADFIWSAATYPGSTNPNLDGKPVFVLAVKGEDPTANPSYSFINMQLLADTYTGGDGDGSATVAISGYQISVNVNLSANAGNIITKDANGKLYAAHQDISGLLRGRTASDDEINAMLNEVFT